MILTPATDAELRLLARYFGPTDDRRDLETLRGECERFLDPYQGGFAEVHKRLRLTTGETRRRTNERRRRGRGIQ